MQFEWLYRELETGAEMVRCLVRGVNQLEAQTRPSVDAWSILEVVCHLGDEERLDFRTRLDILLHRPQDKWPTIDPTGWVTAHHYQEQDLSEQLDQFLAERQRSLAWLRGLNAPNWENSAQAPFGLIKAGDIFSAWVAHDNLHIRQLVELRRARIETITAPYDIRYAGDW